MNIVVDDLATISKPDLQKIMVVGTHLHQYYPESPLLVEEIIQDQGFVQLDPLNPAGRNHDFFFCSNSEIYPWMNGQNGISRKKSIRAAFSSFEYDHERIFSSFLL